MPDCLAKVIFLRRQRTLSISQKARRTAIPQRIRDMLKNEYKDMGSIHDAESENAAVAGKENGLCFLSAFNRHDSSVP